MSAPDLMRFFDADAYHKVAEACNDAIRSGRWDPDGKDLSRQAYQMYADARKAEDADSGLLENEMWNTDQHGNRVGKIVFVPMDMWEDKGPYPDPVPEPEKCSSCGAWLPMVTMWGITNRLALFLSSTLGPERGHAVSAPRIIGAGSKRPVQSTEPPTSRVLLPSRRRPIPLEPRFKPRSPIGR